jgi:hypothetical protein
MDDPEPEKEPEREPEPEATERPFDAYFQNWLDTYVKQNCKPATNDNYETAFRLYLKPQFGSRDLASITRDDVKQLVYKMLSTPRRRPRGRSRRRSSPTLHKSRTKRRLH